MKIYLGLIYPFLLAGALSWTASAAPLGGGVTCGPIPSPPGTEIVWQNYTSTQSSIPGSAVKYACRNGDQPVGPDTVFCQDNGNWTSLPKCTNGIVCLPVADLPNGRILTSTVNVKAQAKPGDSVTFICDSLFILVGTSNTVKCQDDGTWSAMPSCVVSSPSCGEPPNVLNAREVTRTFTSPTGQAGNRVRYECFNGYNTVGRSTITCLPDGKWSDSPRCVPDLSAVNGNSVPAGNSCGSALPLTNGYLQAQSYSSDKYARGGDTLLYSCNANYFLNGSGVVTCDSKALIWTQMPVCLPNGCGVAPVVMNAVIVFQNFTDDLSMPGSIVRYNCSNGFKLRQGSNDIAVCSKTRVWSSSPICDNTCPQAPVIQGGQPVSRFGSEGLPVLAGDSIVYSCAAGLTLMGSARVICQQDGSWSEPPQCSLQLIACQNPPSIANGIILSKEYASPTGSPSAGDRVRYACNPGYAMVGSPVSICDNVTRAFTPIPSCSFYTPSCGNPPLVANAEIASSTFGARVSQPGDSATYRCKRGYIMTGEGTISCNGNPPQWTTTMPTCTFDTTLTCGPFPQTIINGYFVETTINDTNWERGRASDTVTFACFNGYVMIGPPKIICFGSPLIWSDVPFCRDDRATTTELVVPSRLVPAQTFRVTIPTIPTAPPVIPVVTPAPVIIVIVTRTRATPTTTTTTTAEALTEEAVEYDGCPSPPSIRNAAEVAREFADPQTPRDGDTITYQCNSGFTLIGRDQAICLDGSWRVQVSCQPTSSNADPDTAANNNNQQPSPSPSSDNYYSGE